MGTEAVKISWPRMVSCRWMTGRFSLAVSGTLEGYRSLSTREMNFSREKPFFRAITAPLFQRDPTVSYPAPSVKPDSLRQAKTTDPNLWPTGQRFGSYGFLDLKGPNVPAGLPVYFPLRCANTWSKMDWIYGNFAW